VIKARFSRKRRQEPANQAKGAGFESGRSRGWQMPDRKELSDQNETPEDVATLYSWANLHGAKYRDFSASRERSREEARLRAQAAIDERYLPARADTEAMKAVETQQTAEAARIAAQAASRRLQWTTQTTVQEPAQQATKQGDWQQTRSDHLEHFTADTVSTSAPPTAAPHDPQPPFPQFDYAGYPQPPQASRPGPNPSFGQPPMQPHYAPTREESLQEPFNLDPHNLDPRGLERNSERGSGHNSALNLEPGNSRGTQVDPRATAGRSAWLASEGGDELVQPRPQAPAPQASIPQAPVAHAPVSLVPEDTLQGSRDRLTSRWYALRGVFAGDRLPEEAAPAPAIARAPVMAVFSLAGGVGKTSLVATLGRALSARGERVLLVDTAAYGLLPFFFGAQDQRPGALRTFSPPGVSSDAQIQMIALDPESLGPESPSPDPLGPDSLSRETQGFESPGSKAGGPEADNRNNRHALSEEITRYALSGVSRVIVDLPTASGATARRVMRLAPLVLVPVVPDMNSVVSVSSIDIFFERNCVAGSKVLLYYVMSQFDPSLPLHLDVREVLRERLGEQLLPFALRRAPAVSEALAEGMTVIDYAPNSTVAEDFAGLAGWIKSHSAPASTSNRGVRWSER
jgi:cellulose biosynthesis protein BcsQ